MCYVQYIILILPKFVFSELLYHVKFVTGEAHIVLSL